MLLKDYNSCQNYIYYKGYFMNLLYNITKDAALFGACSVVAVETQLLGPEGPPAGDC